MHSHNVIQPLVEPFAKGVVFAVGELNFTVGFNQAMEFLQHFFLGLVHHRSVDGLSLQISAYHNLPSQRPSLRFLTSPSPDGLRPAI